MKQALGRENPMRKCKDNAQSHKASCVTYILLHFPYVTETFIADEIRALQLRGITVQIVSLLKPGDGPIQPLSKELLPYTLYAPGLFSPTLWKAQSYFLLRSGRLYFHLLLTLLGSPSKNSIMLLAKRLVIFFKSAAVAYELRDSSISLFHAHFAWLSGAAAWICARLLTRPFAVTVHAYDLYAKPDLLKLVLREAGRVVSISEHNLNHITRLGICSRESISVIHCGLNLSEYQHQQQKEVIYLSDEPVRILSVGSLTPKKGHKYLVEACNLLKTRGFKFSCTIIGGGKEESKLRQQITSYGLQKQVILVGARPRPEVFKAYVQHDLFVLASVRAPSGDKDGIPVVLMEAAAMGLTLISTRVSGIPELVLQNETGWLVPPEDPHALAEAISGLAVNPELRKHLGQNARKLIEAKFNLERNAMQLSNLFADVVRSARETKSTAPCLS